MKLQSFPLHSFCVVSLFIGLAGGLIGCNSGKSNESELKYRVLGPSASLLAKQSATVCLVNEAGVEASVTSRMRTDIQTSVQTWIRPLQDFTTQIPSSINVTEVAAENNCGAHDLKVKIIGANGRAYVQSGVVYLFGSSGYGTVLHELGHVFGLHDTYVEGIWRCERGQPTSVMCNHNDYSDALSQDDVEGILDRYCALNSQACSSDAAHKRKVVLAYNDCLGRNPENDAVTDDWAKYLKSSGYPSLKGAICGSPEGKQFNVTRIYSTCLGRKPESQSVIDSWGLEVAQFGFAATQEKVCALSVEGRSHNIAKIYKACLGRSPESEAAINGWGDYYYANGYGATQSAVCYSPEGRGYAVNAAYQTCLNRSPESQQVIDLWGDYYSKNGWNELKSAICNSPEGRARSGR